MSNQQGAGESWSEDDYLKLLQSTEFVENPEPRCPCVLLVDTSGSMAGDRIRSLNEGLVAFQQDLNRHPKASKRVEVAIVTFGGGVNVTQNFVTAGSFTPPMLEANGLTPMGAGILTALDLLETRKQVYKQNGILYYRPWLFLITDGEPQGEEPAFIQQATQRLEAAQAGKHLALFAVGVEEANMIRLGEISTQRPPVKLHGLQFVEMFLWLSNSTQRVSESQPSDNVRLPPVDWGSV